jgi:hypothetical protein
MFVDFEKAAPSEPEKEVYEIVDAVLSRSSGIIQGKEAFSLIPFPRYL